MGSNDSTLAILALTSIFRGTFGQSSFRNRSIHTLDVPVDRHQLIDRHRSPGVDFLSAGIVLQWPGERHECAGGNGLLPRLEQFGDVGGNRCVQRSQYHGTFLDAPLDLAIASPGAIKYLFDLVDVVDTP